MKRILVTCATALLLTGAASAQDHPEHPKNPPPQPAAAEQEAPQAAVLTTVTGQNFCLGCALKKEQGAGAQCDKYGHRHALKVTNASADGKDQAEMKGWVLTYLDTDKAQPYITGKHEAVVKVKGKVYAQERVLEVVE